MTIFDLLFLVLFLAAVVTALLTLIAALRGRRERALRLLRRLALGAGLYLTAMVAVSLLSPGRTLSLNEEQCSDDWCISVTRFRRTSGQATDSVGVDFRLASRAGRISQREQFVVAYLKDADGRRYDAQPSEGAVPFDVLLGPLDAVTTTRVFLVPHAASALGVIIARAGAGRFPGCCIIGDEGSLLHPRSVIQLR